jgi:hypothetical protein
MRRGSIKAKGQARPPHHHRASRRLRLREILHLKWDHIDFDRGLSGLPRACEIGSRGRASPGASAVSTPVVAPLSNLVGATRLPIGRFPWRLCVRKIWIGNARRGEARCIGVALRHRAIAAVDGFASAPVPTLQADRSIPAKCLGLSWCGRQNRDRCPNGQSRNAHQNFLTDRRHRISASKQTKPIASDQFTFARTPRVDLWGRVIRSRLSPSATGSARQRRREIASGDAVSGGGMSGLKSVRYWYWLLPIFPRSPQ